MVIPPFNDVQNPYVETPTKGVPPLLGSWKPWNDMNHEVFHEILVGKLVGGWTNPFEKYARQIGFIFPK